MGRRPKTQMDYGEGTIFYSNSQHKWMGQVNIGRDENGKIKRKSVYGATPEEVKEKLNQIKYSIYSGTFLDVSHIKTTAGRQACDERNPGADLLPQP